MYCWSLHWELLQQMACTDQSAFSLENKEEFVRLMLAEIPARPLKAEQIRATNLGLDPATT